ncbi:MAG: mechanosensitive ion channel [Alphaproteobacteria bacterium]|nr:mechanosensitive ion channel [Alphaproteobacteria bacterium]
MNKLWSMIINPSAWVAKLLLVAIVVGLIFLDRNGSLLIIQEFLDDDAFALHLGAYRFSLYVLVSTVFVFLVICWFTGAIAQTIENRLARHTKMRRDTQILIAKFLQTIGYGLAALVALNVLGVDLTALAVLGGAIGVGIGFGLQKIASNFISGLILLLEESVEINDLVELEGGIIGFVRYTGARYTVIETFQNYEVMVPNENFVTQRVTNWTYKNTHGRVEVPIGVAYGADLERARDLILEAATEHPRSMDDPAPACYLREFADSSVNFLLFFWVADVVEGRYAPQSEVMFSIWKKFKNNDIKIPYPQRDIHIKTEE